MKAFGIKLEVMDQCFHRLLHFGALGWADLAVIAAHRAFGHVAQALLHDARRLADFFNPDHEPVIAIAARTNRHVKFHPVIGIIRLRFAQIPGDAGAADHRARKAPFDSIILADNRDINIALFEDAVVSNQADCVFKQARHAIIKPVSNIGQQPERHILMNTTGAEPGCVHTRTRHTLEKVQAILADFKHPQVRRHCAYIHHMAAEIEHMVADSGQFSK